MSYDNAYTAYVDGWNVGYYHGRMDELNNADYRIKRPDGVDGQLIAFIVDDVLTLPEVTAIDDSTERTA